MREETFEEKLASVTYCFPPINEDQHVNALSTFDLLDEAKYSEARIADLQYLVEEFQKREEFFRQRLRRAEFKLCLLEANLALDAALQKDQK